MIAVLCLLVGLIAGAGAAYGLCERGRRERARPVALDGVRWERGNAHLVPGAVKHMRRFYPTHELVMGCQFLELVQARGAASEAVRRRCDAWGVGVVMVDRRTGAISRIVLWDEDADMGEKGWILRRAGYRVTSMSRDITETALVETMAA